MMVLVKEPACSRCGGPTSEAEPFTQHPLFLHGGYGEARSTTVRICEWCGRLQVARQESIRPAIHSNR